MPQIDFRLGIPPGFAILGVAVAAALAYFFYRSTIPPVSRARRVTLAALRAAALALLVLVVCDPLLGLIFTSSYPPSLSVLVDNSRSMSITDRSGTRADVVHSLLGSPALTALRERATIRILPFGTRVYQPTAPSGDSLSFSDDGTDIAGALAAVRDDDRVLHSGAVLLLTDGIVTLGDSPLQPASGYPVPIFTVGIGDSSDQTDVLVQRLATNAIVYSGTPTPVQVMIHASGYQNERVEVTLADGNTPAAHATLQLEPGSRDYAVPLTWMPGPEGLHVLTAAVSALPGELTTRNNRSTAVVRVRKSKLHLVILAGGPSYDLSFFRNAAEEDQNLRVTVFTQTLNGAFYEGAPGPAALDSADCIAFIGMPTAATSSVTLNAVAEAITRRHIPFLWIGGRTVEIRHGGTFDALLPFSATEQSSVEQEIGVDPLPSERNAPLLVPAEPGEPSPWQELPPVFTTRTTFAAKPGTTVLAGARLQNVPIASPVLVVRNQPHQRAVALLAYGIWRWRLLAQRSATAAGFFPRFVANVLHWLTAPEDVAPLVVRPLQTLFGQGEPLSFEAQVYDVRQQPVEDAQVRIVVQQRNQAMEGTLTPAGHGRYEGTLPGVSEEGVYRYRATAGREGFTLGTDSGSVRVGGTHVEFLTTQMNAPLLRAVAARSGGLFLAPGEISRLSDSLAAKGFFIPRKTTDGTEIPLRAWPYMVAAIVALLGVEWFIRKRSGMM